VKFTAGNRVLYCMDKTTFTNPHKPADGPVCPIFDFTLDTAQKFFLSVKRLNAFESPSISIGSPSGVAEPCPSIYEMSSGLIPAFCQALKITSSWAFALGAVRLPDK